MSTKPVITYDYSIAASPGAATPKNHLSLFNPVGSGKLLAAGAIFLTNSLTSPSAAVAPMRGFRTTAASAGTLIAAADFCKFDTAHPASIAQVRIDNPTVTLGPAFFNSPPSLTNRSSDTHDVTIPPGAGRFLIRPGEGIVLRQDASTTDLTWNLSVVWAEIG